jgi:hypothetical protein
MASTTVDLVSSITNAVVLSVAVPSQRVWLLVDCALMLHDQAFEFTIRAWKAQFPDVSKLRPGDSISCTGLMVYIDEANIQLVGFNAKSWLFTLNHFVMVKELRVTPPVDGM